MLDMVVRFSLPDPKALHPVRTFWIGGEELRGYVLNYEEPLACWTWWSAFPSPTQKRFTQ